MVKRAVILHIILNGIILFGLAAFALTYRDGVFWGDSASNDLLTLKAKKLLLTHGNYSRVGIMHPGGLWFYILAVFDGISSLVTDGRIGQIFATLALHIYGAILLGRTIARHIFYMNSEYIGYGLALFVLLFNVGVTLRSPHASIYIFNGWMPSVYLSFMCIYLSGILGIHKDFFTRALYVIIGASLLINGHVSFCFIVGLPTFYIALVYRKKILSVEGLVLVILAFLINIPLLMNVLGTDYILSVVGTFNGLPGQGFSGFKVLIALLGNVVNWFLFLGGLFFIGKFMVNKTFPLNQLTPICILLLCSFYYMVNGIDTVAYTYVLWWMSPIAVVLIAFFIKGLFNQQHVKILVFIFIALVVISHFNVQPADFYQVSKEMTLRPKTAFKAEIERYKKIAGVVDDKTVEVGNMKGHEGDWAYQALLMVYLAREGHRVCAKPISSAVKTVYPKDLQCQ